MKLLLAVALSVLGLSGCDITRDLGEEVERAARLAAPQTIVIGPGQKAWIDGRAVSFSGVQPCPYRQGLDRLLPGQDLNEGSMSCVIISPDTKEVTVRVVMPGGISQQVWSVERDHGQTKLRLTDGSYLAALK